MTALRRRSPPRTEAELLARARALAGHSLFEIACALRAPGDPEGGLHGKGQAGTLLEAALGAPLTSGETHDFPELQVELKTVPLQKNGVPRESTYVCHFALDRAPTMEWNTSWARAKLHRVLFVTTSDSRTPWAERMVHGATLWTPDAEEEAVLRSDFEGPVNIGSDEMVSINQLVGMVAEIAGKTIHINHIPGPLGVRGRNSDNRLIQEKLGWSPSRPLVEGLETTYAWIEAQTRRNAA